MFLQGNLSTAETFTSKKYKKSSTLFRDSVMSVQKYSIHSCFHCVCVIRIGEILIFIIIFGTSVFDIKRLSDKLHSRQN